MQQVRSHLKNARHKIAPKCPVAKIAKLSYIPVVFIVTFVLGLFYQKDLLVDPLSGNTNPGRSGNRPIDRQTKDPFLNSDFNLESIPPSWVNEMKARRSRLLQQCQAMKDEWTSRFTNQDGVSDELVSSPAPPLSKFGGPIGYLTYVDQKHKFLFCGVPKVAIMNWRVVLLQLSGKHLSAQSLMDIIQSSDSWEEDIPRIEGKLDGRHDGFLKVMFVRHPFERLLHDDEATFENFVKRVISSYDPRSRSLKTVPGHIHWGEMYQLCDPCNVRYDIIGHYDTLTEDASNVLKLLGTNVTFPSEEFIESYRKGNRHGYGNTQQMMAQALRKLSGEDRRTLSEIFKVDGRLFGFDVNMTVMPY
ncbi:carbohydrate sulfotransferase 11-like [Lingula anatina]|uniref:Carbohydrate sulfotransferase n=1 Tax=Lingula anatina TaxID=7574 RepID=A0A1S3IE14_LINAN|nr:carbohydrate sulfotransferase 11-like [Lingula anatina]|eukprot:XP_013395694.1 carbohydrate sulfotransferase 11-like [Lingula anatina]